MTARQRSKMQEVQVDDTIRNVFYKRKLDSSIFRHVHEVASPVAMRVKAEEIRKRAMYDSMVRLGKFILEKDPTKLSYTDSGYGTSERYETELLVLKMEDFRDCVKAMIQEMSVEEIDNIRNDIFIVIDDPIVGRDTIAK